MRSFKLLLFFVVFLSFSFFYLSFRISRAKADTAFPDGGKVPCDVTKYPEFNSDRPYQASPCGDAPKALFCSNSIVMTIGSVSTPYCGSDTCNVDITKHVDKIVIDLTNVKLPVLGNTQDVKNGKNPDDNIDDATKVNEYVSWYLNGVNNKAENGSSKNTDNEIVNLSGPIQKLLPQQIQEAQRIATINTTKTSVTSAVDDSGKTQPEISNHNQVVVCYKKEIPLLPNWLTNLVGMTAVGLGKALPQDCYNNLDDLSILRLQNWDDKPIDIGYQAIQKWILDHHLYPADFANEIIASATIDRWPKKTPPLPWSDQEGKPFKTNEAYQKAYNEWRGDLCAYINLPFFGRKLACISIPGVTNSDYADLFPYIPLANTTDKKSGQTINSVEIQSGGRAIIDQDSKHYEIIKDPVLYFAHTQETSDLISLLQSTFKPQPGTEHSVSSGLPNDVEDNSLSCQTVQSYVNPGDDVTFDTPKSYLEIDNINYHVSSIKCSNPHEEQECDLRDPPTGICLHRKNVITADCSDDIYVTIPMQNKTTNLDEIWENSVAGDQSVFRRIYPKTGADAPVSCIADIPGESGATYTSGTNLDINQVIEPGGGTVGSLNKGSKSIDAKMYFPHLGGVANYFLKGIQTALRPQGLGGQVASSLNCSNIVCGELPKFPKSAGSCNLGSVSSRVGKIPQSLKDIVSSAAQTYKVPPNLILGIMYGEGLFNPHRLNWSDTNVKNWATCQRVPNCSESGDDNFMGFNGNDWDNIKGKILPDLKKLDPNKKVADRCNLLDAVYGLAWNLHDSADGGMGFQCFGIDLQSSVPQSCDWNNNQYESAIKIAENGYDQGCFTLAGSCATGGGNAALCNKGTDGCETISNPGNRSSHNACVWDVGHGK